MPGDIESLLLENLRKIRVLDPGQVADATSLRKAPEATDASVADELVRRGWLTRYQADALTASESIGPEVGPYLILERIGRGGMGEVFKAVHRQMHREVALKIISESRRADPGARSRFLREARASARLSHPNIVSAYDVREEGGLVYLALEYVDGKDVHQMLQEQPRLHFGVAARIALHVAQALEHAHERGIVHRDVKPSNILVDKTGVVKVLDMGLARIDVAVAETADGPLTDDRDVMGTVDYMAPEQARSTHLADIRSDIYSLGCTLYHMLTGQIPFPDGTAAEKLLRHQMAEPDSITSLAPDIPFGLAQIVGKMMAKLPEDRYQTPSELIRVLRPWAADDSKTRAPAAGATPAGMPPFSDDERTVIPHSGPDAGSGAAAGSGALSRSVVWKVVRRRRAVMVATVLALVVLVVSGLWLTRRRSPDLPTWRPAELASLRSRVERVRNALRRLVANAPEADAWRRFDTRWSEGREAFLAKQHDRAGRAWEAALRDGVRSACAAVSANLAKADASTPRSPESLGEMKTALWAMHETLRAKPDDAEAGTLAGRLRTLLAHTNEIGMRLVYLPPGDFMLGSPPAEPKGSSDDDERLHERVMENGFYMGAHEVTRAQFATFVKDASYTTDSERSGRVLIRTSSALDPWQMVRADKADSGRYGWRNPNFEQEDNHPVVCVTWHDAVAFCRWLSKREGRTYRLPTEAEWEYACRAGRSTPFHTGAQITTDMANFYGLKGYPPGTRGGGTFRKRTVAVGGFAPNAWGLYDMHGNVWEWCQDPYRKAYPLVEDEAGPAPAPMTQTKVEYVRRGGGWASSPMHCRSANRYKLPPDLARSDSGFRVVLEDEP